MTDSRFTLRHDAVDGVFLDVLDDDFVRVRFGDVHVVDVGGPAAALFVRLVDVFPFGFRRLRPPGHLRPVDHPVP